VQVCPTGIDIRDGLQYQCIACGACIDVCDTVMEKMNYPKGLIRYTTQNELDGAKPRRIVRPRVLVYSAILGMLTVALIVAVLLRVPLQLDVIRDRNSLYRETPEGLIENVYTLKILNMDARAHRFTLRAEGIEDLRLVRDGASIAAGAGEVIEVPVRLQAEEDELEHRSSRVQFILQSEDDSRLRVREQARFLGPERER
jgi:cytochrome c oxidase accessory protein FixG